MIKMISCKCPECGASLEVDENRTYTFCSYCGTKILLQNDNVHVYREINEAEIKRVEASERFGNRLIDHEEKKISLKIKLIVAYAVFCMILCAASFLMNKYGTGYTWAFLAFRTIVMMTIPFVIMITKSIFEHEKTVVTTNTSSSLFGLF